MNRLARLAAQFAVLFFALALPVSASADELQDIDGLLKRGQHAQALERVNRYLAQNPSDAQGRFKKGLILAEQSKVAEAIEVFTKLSQDYPKLPEPHNNLAVLYASQGQYEKARQQLEVSIRTDPRFATAYENLGDVYTKLSLIRDLLITSEPRLPASSIAQAGKTAEPARPSAAATAPKKSATGTKPAPGQAKNPAAKPAEQPARAREGNTEDVLQAVRAWAGAWAKQDVDAYLAFYAKDFKTPKGETRAEWEAARKQRISTPKKIEVAVDSPKVTLKGDNGAVVSFRQAYRSDGLKINGNKTLHLVRSDGRWLIQQERA